MDKGIIRDFAVESRIELIEKIKLKLSLYYVGESFNIKQNGDIFTLINDTHSLSLTIEEYQKRELLIKRINEIGIERVIEEAAYTWFNRLIAIRYMDVHNFLPLGKNGESMGIKILSSVDDKVEPEIMKFSNLKNQLLDISFDEYKYTQLQNDNEKFKYLLKLICDKLKRFFPLVFGGITDYIDLLVPENMLSETGFVSKIIKELPVEFFDKVEIIGWLYQYYNTENNNLVYDGNMSKSKIPKHLVPAATQIFTPDWVVHYMVENSLNKAIQLDSEKYIYKLGKNNDSNLNLENVKFLDPCCGSGHILLYAFEIFYDAYYKLGYSKNDIPSKILKNNIYGLEIDERAAQLSILTLMLKAREYDAKLFDKNIDLNVVDIIESNGFDRTIIDYLPDEIKEDVKYILDVFIDSKEYGSLIKIQTIDFDNIIMKLENVNNIFVNSAKHFLIRLIKQAKILNYKYTVIVTNPPYLNSSRFDDKLINYVNKEYELSKADLSTAILERTIKDFSEKNGYISFVTTTSWMYLKNFEKIRKYILENTYIESLIDYGTELFDGKVGHNPIVAWTMKNTDKIDTMIAIKLSDFCYSRRNEKKNEFFNEKNRYTINQLNILDISGYPLAYWINQSMIDAINTGDSIDSISDFTGGQHKTADNDKYLRFFWEVDYEKCGKNKKWIQYAKGGEFRKYYGNLEYVVDWSDEALNYYRTNPTSNLIDEKYWYEEGITFTKITSKGSSFRYLPPNGVFDMGGPSLIKVKNLYYCLGLLNSSVADNFFKMVNPTINLQNKDVKSLPILFPNNYDDINYIESLVKECVELAKFDWDSYETSSDFKCHPLVNNEISSSNLIKERFNKWDELTNVNYNKMKTNEEKINDYFAKLYGQEISSNIEPTIRKADISKDIKSFISYFVGCLFGRYSLDKNGLICTNKNFNIKNYQKFIPDEDHIIPIYEDGKICFEDDIIASLKTFLITIFGEDSLEQNLDFISLQLGKKGIESSESCIRRYFLNDFFDDHVKIFQKRPIYWLIDSGKKNGFKALIYIHQYGLNTISKVRVDYLHRTQDMYERKKSELINNISNGINIKESQNILNELTLKLDECNLFDEKIGHLANQMIEIDLDDGIKVNYDKLSSILAKIK